MRWESLTGVGERGAGLDAAEANFSVCDCVTRQGVD